MCLAAECTCQKNMKYGYGMWMWSEIEYEYGVKFLWWNESGIEWKWNEMKYEYGVKWNEFVICIFCKHEHLVTEKKINMKV